MEDNLILLSGLEESVAGMKWCECYIILGEFINDSQAVRLFGTTEVER